MSEQRTTDPKNIGQEIGQRTAEQQCPNHHYRLNGYCPFCKRRLHD